jgi:hypothetical protein
MGYHFNFGRSFSGCAFFDAKKPDVGGKMTENSNDPGRRADRSIFFPLLIIFSGVLLLLSNLNYISGDFWSLIIRFWPIFFVIGGIDDLLNRKWTGAIINFGIGSILILANFGLSSMSTWQIITNYWPILVIGIGLDIIFRGRSVLGSLVGVGLAIVLILGLFWFAFLGTSPNEVTSKPIRFELGDIQQAELNIKPLAGKLILNKADSNEQLLDGEIFSANHDDLSIESELNGKTQKITISSPQQIIIPSKNMSNNSPWELFLNADVPFLINIEQVIGAQDLLLTGLNIQDLESNLVIGTMKISLPDIEKLEGDLECIIGEMVIVVPEGLSVTIELNSGMTGVTLSDGFTRAGDTIYSKNFNENKDSVKLKVNLPMGSLKVMHP